MLRLSSLPSQLKPSSKFSSKFSKFQLSSKSLNCNNLNFNLNLSSNLSSSNLSNSYLSILSILNSFNSKFPSNRLIMEVLLPHLRIRPRMAPNSSDTARWRLLRFQDRFHRTPT